MGAIIVSIFVSVIACVGGIYFYIQEHKKKKRKDRRKTKVETTLVHPYFLGFKTSCIALLLQEELPDLSEKIIYQTFFLILFIL